MPPMNDPHILNEIHRLVAENNRMLHAQRRSSFFWGVLKFIVYLVLFAAPIWFYMNYVSGTLDSLVNTVNQAQGTQIQIKNKFSGFETVVKDFESKLPAFLRPGATTTATLPATTTTQ